MKVIVGTSGWMYKDWGQRFYPKDIKQKDMLPFFSKNFPTVEINSTFYRMPTESSVKHWHDTVPEGFIFAVKASRYLTHIIKLEKVPALSDSLDNYVGRVGHLKEKLGPVLVQLPASFHVDTERLINLGNELKKISKKHKLRLQIAIEFRHKSWFTDETMQILRKNNMAAVVASGPGRWPETREVTADFAYLRFHGDKKLYGSSYSEKELDRWADFIKQECGQCKQVFCYFNNDQSAKAVDNAKYLRSLF